MTEFYVVISESTFGIARKLKAVIVVLFAAARTCAMGSPLFNGLTHDRFSNLARNARLTGSSKQAHTRPYLITGRRERQCVTLSAGSEGKAWC